MHNSTKITPNIHHKVTLKEKYGMFIPKIPEMPMDEIKHAVEKMKHNKVPGSAAINAKMMREAGNYERSYIMNCLSFITYV